MSCPYTKFINGQVDYFESKFYCGKSNENPNYGITSFDNLLYTLLVLIQSLTKEGWSITMDDVKQTSSQYSYLYFESYIIIASFYLLNLTLAVIYFKFNDAHKEKAK